MTRAGPNRLDAWRAGAQYLRFRGDAVAWRASADAQAASGEGGADEKPWLLLIHGYPTSSWDWTALWPQLEGRYQLAALDMLGFGLSDKPRRRVYSIFDQADLQEALLEHLGVGEAHVLAHDYGDTVGQELLARHNEGSLSFSVRSMCFLNGGLFPEQHRARPIQKLGLTPLGPLIGLTLNRARLRKTFDGIFGPATKASDAEIDAHWALIREKGGARVLHRLLRYIPERIAHRERWVGALKETRVPLRLVIGGADPVSGAHLYHYYREQIEKPDAVLLEKIGHYPHTESPEATAAAFLDFQKALGAINA